MRRPLTIAAALLVAACGQQSDEQEAVRTPMTPTPVTPTPTSDPALPWGPTEEQYRQAAAIVDEMSVEERAGQVIVAHYAGTEPPVDLVQRLHLGGVIVMGDNVESPEQLRDSAEALQAAHDRPYPLVVAVDQEGGKVARVREPATEFPSLMTLGAADDPGLAAGVARASGQELRAMGFTMVFAPDADVTTGPDDPTIGTRSAGSDPALVSRIVTGAVRGYLEAGIVAVAKHFPGHGSVPADSHVELPVQQAPVAELEERDFVPFREAVAAGVPAVMVAHIDVEDVDPGVPSSVSPEVVRMLRDHVGFDGVVVTDAQDMDGLAAQYGPGEAAVGSLNAGADIVLMPADVDAAHAGIVEATTDGRLDPDRLAEAATRVVALMLHQAAGSAPPDLEVVGAHGDVAYAAALAGMTVVSGECDGRLVGDAIQVVGGSDADRARMTAAAEAAGLDVGHGDVVRLVDGQPDESADGDVVVSLDAPYPLSKATANAAQIALYARTADSFRALADVLTGAASPGGRLPVEVPGIEREDCD